MKTEDIIKHLKLQDSNMEFRKNEIKRLESQIESIQHISDIHNDIDLYLKKDSYTK